jgi:hypothetical protein
LPLAHAGCGDTTVKALTLLLRACGTPGNVLRIDVVEQLLTAMAAKDSRRLPRLEVPMSLAATEGAFTLAGGWHPFVAAIRDGPGVLARFYGGFQPTSLAELYSLAGVDRQLGPRQLPWLPPPRGYRGEMGLGPDHGISLFGPCTDEKVALEEARLKQIVASITARGYLPDRFGDITGYFLMRQDEFRFVVRGGKHRSAALAALGWTHLPVRLKPGWEPVVSLETLGEWPLVRSGAIPAPQARRVFERYFEWNGTEQHRRIAP